MQHARIPACTKAEFFGLACSVGSLFQAAVFREGLISAGDVFELAGGIGQCGFGWQTLH